MTDSPTSRHYLATFLGWHPFSIMQGCRNRSRFDPSPDEWEPLPSLNELRLQVEAKLELAHATLYRRYKAALKIVYYQRAGGGRMATDAEIADILVTVLRNHEHRQHLARQMRMWRRESRLPANSPHTVINPVFAAGCLYALRQLAHKDAAYKEPHTKWELFGPGRMSHHTPPCMHLHPRPEEDED